MKNALKALVNWLDRKFPDTIIVTVAEYNRLNERLVEAEAACKGLPERLAKMEGEINKFNVSLGFAGTVSNKMGAFQR